MDDIDAIEQITDPAERAREAGRLLDPARQARLRAIRQAAVRQMHANGASFSDIGAKLGVHRVRAAQIHAGKTGGGKGGTTVDE